jgi:hypothetical protein
VLTSTGSGTLTFTTVSGGGSSISVGTITSTSNVNGASIASGILNLAPADASNGGVVTTGTQSFAGNKTILGTLNVSTFNSGESVDINNPSGSTSLAGTTQWQSFTAGVSGALTKITIYGGSSSAPARNGTLNIYAGTGNAGTRLSTQTVALPTTGGFPNPATWDLVLAAPINITAGQVYTFEILDAASVAGMSGTSLVTNIPRLSGTSYYTSLLGLNISDSRGTYGLSFKTWVSGATGGSITTVGNITAGAVTYPSAHGTSGQVLTTTGSGTLTWTSAGGGSGVPYTGASQAVNLGGYDLTVNGMKVGRGAGNILSNTTLGQSSLISNTTGSNSTAVGYGALLSSTTGTENTGFGSYSLYNTNTGNYNTAIGITALNINQTGSNNTALGYEADVVSVNLNNATAIGNGAKVAASNTIQLGNTSVSNVKTSGTLTAGTVTYPKEHGASGQVLTTTGTGSLTWTDPGVHTLGETYGGGIVFYVYDGGKHGLIAATEDQGTGVSWREVSSEYIAVNVKRDGVNSGMLNTERIIAQQYAGTYAAQLCADYRGGGFGDWYLPSKFELNLLWIQTGYFALYPPFSTDYWSSTESSNTIAWAQNFTNGFQFNDAPANKNATKAVRAIRAF